MIVRVREMIIKTIVNDPDYQRVLLIVILDVALCL